MFIIDSADLWDDLPIFSQVITPLLRSIAGALGLI
jgi:hypothetical protein